MSLTPGLQLDQPGGIADAIADGRSGREHLGPGIGTHRERADSWHAAHPDWYILGPEANTVLYLGKV